MPKQKTTWTWYTVMFLFPEWSRNNYDELETCTVWVRARSLAEAEGRGRRQASETLRGREQGIMPDEFFTLGILRGKQQFL